MIRPTLAVAMLAWALVCALGWTSIATFGAVGSAYAARPQEPSARTFEEALGHFGKGDFNAAIIELKNALRDDPGNLAARVLIGRAYLKLGDGASAEKELRRALDAGADDALVLVPLAQAYLEQRAFDALLTDVRPGGRATDIETQIQVARGRALLGKLEIDAADRAFAAATRLDRNAADALVGQAWVRISRGKWDAARSLFDQALNAAPENAWVWYTSGRLFYMQRRFNDAIRDFSRTITLHDRHYPARVGRAAALISLGAYERSRPDLMYVRDADPVDPEALYYLSLVQREAGDDSEALTTLKTAEYLIRNFRRGFVETYPDLLFIAGMTFLELKNYSDARYHLARLIELEPYRPAARKAFGRLLLNAGRPGDAAEVLEPAKWLTADDAELLTLLGTALMRSGRNERATVVLERAVELAPDYVTARGQLGLNRLVEGRRDEAVDELMRTLRKAERPTRAGMMLILIHLRGGNFAEALEVANTLLAVDPDNPWFHNFAGAAHLGLEDTAAARESFDRALAIDPDYRPAALNLAQLDEAEGNIAAARNRYLAILEADPVAGDAMLPLARLAQNEGNADETIAWLEKIRSIDRRAVGAHLQLVRLYLDSGEFEKAVVLAREVREANPASLPILEALGRAQLASGAVDSAASSFYAMVDLARDSPEELVRVAMLQIGADDLNGAHQTLGRATVAYPGHLPAHLAIIELEGRINRFDAAAARIEELRKKLPGDAVVDRLAGDLAMRQGRYRSAAEAYAKGLEKAEDSELMVRLVDARRRAGDGIDLALLEDWLARKPDDLRVSRALASAYLTEGRLGEAVTAHERLIHELPDDALLFNNLAWLYHKTGDPRARRYEEKAAEMAPSDPRVLDTLGWILVEDGEPDRGLSVLREAFSREARDPRILYHIAVALSRLGRTGEARAELRRVIRAGTDPAVVADARALLRELSGG